jgi:hypothetical protein
MKSNKLQLCVHGKNIAGYKVSTLYPGFVIDKVNKVENPNYLFVDITLAASIKPGVAELKFTDAKGFFTYSYKLEQKGTAKGRIQGVGPANLRVPHHARPLRQWLHCKR